MIHTINPNHIHLIVNIQEIKTHTIDTVILVDLYHCTMNINLRAITLMYQITTTGIHPRHIPHTLNAPTNQKMKIGSNLTPNINDKITVIPDTGLHHHPQIITTTAILVHEMSNQSIL